MKLRWKKYPIDEYLKLHESAIRVDNEYWVLEHQVGEIYHDDRGVTVPKWEPIPIVESWQ